MNDAAVRDPHAALLRMLETTARQRAERRADVQKLQSSADDYEELEHTLRELPAKVEHKILVPFGKLAFFPGVLRHTNEVMVLLGDNYFALRSAEQAAGIARRRAEYVRPQVAAAQAEVDTLTSRIRQIRAYGEMQDVQPGTFEIREEYCSDEGEDAGDDDNIAMPLVEHDDDSEDDEGDDKNAKGEGVARARGEAGMLSRDSDDDTDDDDDSGLPHRPDLPPLLSRPAAHATKPSSSGRTGQKSVTFDPKTAEAGRSGGSIGGSSDGSAGSGRAPGQTPGSSASAKTAFSQQVVEREAACPPSEMEIGMRDASRELAQLQLRRAARGGDAEMPERADRTAVPDGVTLPTSSASAPT